MKIIAFLLTLAILLTLFGCQPETEYSKDIIFTEDVPVPEEGYLRAEEVFFCLLLTYTRQSGISNPSEKLISDLHSYANRASMALKNLDLTPEGFDILLDIFERDGEAVITELANSGGSYSKAKELYLTLSATLGADLVGECAYELLAVYYEIQQEELLSDYEKYGYGYLLIDSERMGENRRVLSEEIGRDSFRDFLVSALALGELISPDELAVSYDGFTDEELLLFVTSINLNFEISTLGWEHLIYTLTYASGGAGEAVATAMRENADSSLLAEKAESALALLNALRSNLTKEDMAYIREGNLKMAMSLAFSRLGEEEWESLREIFELELHREAYEAILTDLYGEEYLGHAEAVQPVSLDALREMAGKEEFYEGFVGYLGGISPAYSFGIEK